MPDQKTNEPIPSIHKADLIYQIEDNLPFQDALFAGLRHLLAIFVAIVTPPLIIAGSLGLDFGTTCFSFIGAITASFYEMGVRCLGPA